MKYPIGIQNFQNLINDGYKYVDKTADIYRLTHTFSAVFLSRPRRFGKSLLLSTIEAYFKGKKELFKGLAMERLEKEWKVYPVVHIDLNNGNYATPQELNNTIHGKLRQLESDFGVSPIEEKLLGVRFEYLIKCISKSTGERVVVLIDEYDKPMTEVIAKELLQEEYRDILKPFYGTLKSAEQYIKFVFITGVTKFAKLSVFSDLNQLKDISLLPAFDTICGITRQEMLENFGLGVEALAQSKGWSLETAIKKLEYKYDGYHFSERLRGVLNPLSLFNSLSDKKLQNYWFRTGTPTFLVELLKAHRTPVNILEGFKASEDLLSSVESMKLSPIPVIYQSGYLTIKSYDEDTEYYTLDYPNEEVRKGFLDYLLPYYANLRNTTSNFEIDRFVDDVHSGNVRDFLKRLQSLLAGCNYDLILDREAHYQDVLYIVFRLMELQVHAESRISSGRIDLLVETERFVYIMEFKYKGTAEEAISQIYEKGYAVPYQCDVRTVILIGVNFDDATRNLDSNWIIEEFQKR